MADDPYADVPVMATYAAEKAETERLEKLYAASDAASGKKSDGRTARQREEDRVHFRVGTTLPERIAGVATDIPRAIWQGVTRGYGDKATAAALSTVKGTPYRDEIRKQREATAETMSRPFGQTLAGTSAVQTGLALPAPASLPGLLGTSAAYGAVTAPGMQDSGSVFDLGVNMAKGAGEGVVSSLVPLGVMGADRWLSNKLSGTKLIPQAVIDRLMSKGMVSPEARQRINALGPQATAMDATDALRTEGAAIRTMPGEGAATIKEVLDTRAAGTNARLRTDVDDALGPVPTIPARPAPSAIQTDSPLDALTGKAVIQDAKRPIGQTIIPTLQAAGPVPQSQVAAVVREIDDLIQNASLGDRALLNRIRNDLIAVHPRPPGAPRLVDDHQAPGGTRLVPGRPGVAIRYVDNPAHLDSLKRNLSNVGFEGSSSLSVDRNAPVKAHMKTLADRLDNVLRGHSPDYAEAMDQLAMLNRQKDALKQGSRIFDKGPDVNTVKPYQVDRTIARDDGASRAPMSVGARSALENKMATSSEDLPAVRTFLGGDRDNSRINMRTIFGEGPTDRVVRVVDRENTFGNTRQAVTGGSQTAGRSGAAAELKDTSSPPQLTQTTLTGWLLKGVNTLSEYAHGTLTKAQREIFRNEVGRRLSLQGAELDAEINRMIAQQNQTEAIRRNAQHVGRGLLGAMP